MVSGLILPRRSKVVLSRCNREAFLRKDNRAAGSRALIESEDVLCHVSFLEQVSRRPARILGSSCCDGQVHFASVATREQSRLEDFLSIAAGFGLAQRHLILATGNHVEKVRRGIPQVRWLFR